MKLASYRGRRWVFLAAASAAVGLVSTAAVAQLANPARQGPARQGSTANDRGGLESAYNSIKAQEDRVAFLDAPNRQSENWQAADRFASCAVGLNEARARELLDQAVEGKAKKTVELGEFLNRNQGCVVAASGLDRDFLRGALAQHIVVTGAPAMPPPGNADSVMTFLKTVKAPRVDKDDPFVAGQLLAECRVGFAPVAARALLATEPGSAAETGALAAMKAVTPQCDSLDTAKLKLTPYFERAYAAQALYHWIGFADAKG